VGGGSLGAECYDNLTNQSTLVRFEVPFRFVTSYAANPAKIRTNLVCSETTVYSSFATFFALVIDFMLRHVRNRQCYYYYYYYPCNYYSVTHGQLRKP